jgi:hypothetical protein
VSLVHVFMPLLSARDIEHVVVTALEACTDYQGPQDEGTRLIWLILDHVKALSNARSDGATDPEIPTEQWTAHLEAARNVGPDAAALAEYARNDIINREVERRVREKLKEHGLT